jgi:glycerol-1-phosphate dehydrogenase [NAD(P)+]
MKEKAKPDFADYGIHLGKVGDNCSDILKEAHSGKLHYVGDTNTLEAAQALIPKDATILSFPDSPKADDLTVEQIRKETASADHLIAVGSGTLNDLCKYASFLDHKSYSVIATAPSMNGYVSGNASITVKAYKGTLAAHTPQKVICDSAILANAPSVLKQAGVGDSLCRSTVQADWLLSYLLTGSHYDSSYFEWLAESEEKLIENPNDSEALIESLLLSGIAMREAGSSAPASQGEHMIAHTMEMLYPDLPNSYHGQQIAVTSLTMAERQERLLQQDTVSIIDLSGFAEMPLSLHKEAQAQMLKKFPSEEVIESYNAKLTEKWPKIAEQISRNHLRASQLRKTLETAGCPTSPEAIDWENSAYQRAMKLARFTRDRMTFLDLN